jgi:hypothetical protein
LRRRKIKSKAIEGTILTESKEKKKNEEKTKLVQEEDVVEEEAELEKEITENIEKIELLIQELDKLNQKGGPDIRICPRCYSLRIKVEDILTGMGINSGYPVCRCLDCGWRSKKWIYLDRTLTEEEREKFVKKLIEEKKEK